MLRRIEPKLNEEECRVVYRRMDGNNDGQVSFGEFMKAICVFTGSPYKAGGGVG